MDAQVSKLVVPLIKRFEGLGDGDKDVPGLQPYVCPAGEPTLGWGSIYGLDRERVTLSHRAISEEEAEYLLDRDMRPAYLAVCRGVKIKLSPSALAALTSFTYNLGSGAFRSSTLRAKINRGDLEGASKEFGRWVNSGGRKLRGLVIRREAERRLFLA